MEGICGVFSSELLANWIGAAGSAGAAFLAVGLYWHDKRSTARRDRAACEASRRGQALHLYTLLQTMMYRLHALDASRKEDGGSILVSVEVSTVRLPDPERLMAALRDASVFGVVELMRLSGAVSSATALNNELAMKTFDRSAKVYMKELDQGIVDEALEKCEQCKTMMGRISLDHAPTVLEETR